jgi:hypothetical protein
VRATTRVARFLLPAGLLALLVSCAPAPQGPASLPAPPAATPAATTPAVPATPKPVVASPAAPDTVPSPAALAVLASIPEPLGDTPRGKKGKDAPGTPPPAPKPVSIPAPAEMADSLQSGEVSAPSDAPAKPVAATNTSDTASIPVPAPTRALGQDAPALPPTPAAPAPPAAEPPATPAQPAAEPIESAAAADTCWRVQVGAPSVRAKAARLRAAAESQLLMRMVVEHERGLWKVRTQDCVNRTTAESLKARALASGFQGVFLVRYIKRP